MIIYRRDKGLPLEIDEFDGNFRDLDNRLKDIVQNGARGIASTYAGEDGISVVIEYTDGTTTQVAVRAPLRPRGQWAPNMTLSVNDRVSNNGTLYAVDVPHTSTTFAADLAAGRLSSFNPDTSSGFRLVGEYDPGRAYEAGEAVARLEGDKVFIFAAAAPVAAGVEPPAAPWTTSSANIAQRLAEIEASNANAIARADSFQNTITDIIDQANLALSGANDALERLDEVENGDIAWARVKDGLNNALPSIISAITSEIAALDTRIDTIEGEGGITSDDVSVPGGGSVTVALEALNDRIDDLDTGSGGGPADPARAEDVGYSDGGFETTVKAALDGHTDRIGDLETRMSAVELNPGSGGGSGGQVDASDVNTTSIDPSRPDAEQLIQYLIERIVELEGRLNDHDTAIGNNASAIETLFGLEGRMNTAEGDIQNLETNENGILSDLAGHNTRISALENRVDDLEGGGGPNPSNP